MTEILDEQSPAIGADAPPAGGTTRLDRVLPLLLVALAVAFGLVVLRAQNVPVPNVNDSSMHEQMVRWAEREIREGRVPLDGWYPNLSMGSAHFHHYQTLPHILTAYAGRVVGTDRAFAWSLYLLLALWPIALYAAVRLMGFGRWVAGVAALLSPLLASADGHGYEHGAYLFRGFGVWSQLFAMWLLPFAWALTWRALHRRGSLALAALAVGLTFSMHFMTGYLAFIGIGIGVIASAAGFWGRVRRGLAIAGGAVAVSSWALVPLLGDNHVSLRSVYYVGTYWRDSYGAGRVFGWLGSGEVFDAGHLPVITVLAGAGLVVALARSKHDVRARAVLGVAAASLVLFIGRPTLGPLIDRIPGTEDLFLHRFVMGVHLSGLILAAIGTVTLGRLALKTVERLDLAIPAIASTLALSALLLGAIAPAAAAAREFAKGNERMVLDQAAAERDDGADYAALVAQARSLGPGRFFSGMRGRWGTDYRIGRVPAYNHLAALDADQVGFTLRTASPSTDIETVFDESRPSNYDLFNVRWLIYPSDRGPAVPARRVAQRGRHVLYEVPASGYMALIDTSTTIHADRSSLLVGTKEFLTSSELTRGVHPMVAFPGTDPPAATAPTTIGASAGRGSIRAQVPDPDAGVFTATVEAGRDAVVMLKASYDPRWRVTIDGERTKAFMVAPSFVAARVPAGTHTVSFAYERYDRYPLLLALGALAIAILSALDRRRNRQQPHHLSQA